MIITKTCLPQATRCSSVRSISGRVDKPDSLQEKELEFLERAKFPSIGNPEHLYIATDEDAMYRYDSSSSKYIRVASTGADTGDDLDKVETINSTLKKEN